MWSRKTFRDGWEGSDATGYSFAHVVPGGRRGAFVPCQASGYPDGLWLGGYETPDEAMDAAHRVVTAHVDAVGLPAVREALRTARLRGHRWWPGRSGASMTAPGWRVRCAASGASPS